MRIGKKECKNIQMTPIIILLALGNRLSQKKKTQNFKADICNV